MFEAKPPATSQPAADSSESAPLREMTWSDLRARLDAVRDLRHVLSAKGVDQMASFDAQSARHIAALADDKHAVNPQDLANGKGSGHITGAAQDTGSGSIPRT
jgi:hypothetical protein